VEIIQRKNARLKKECKIEGKEKIGAYCFAQSSGYPWESCVEEKH
jgi:hypothetical protein